MNAFLVSQHLPMSAIIFKQPRAFNATLHCLLIRQKLANINLDFNSLKNSFRLRHYATTAHFSFHIGWGAGETYHVDLQAYQALLIVQPNQWLLKGVRDSRKSTFQDAGDLIVLDQGQKHGIDWNRDYRKPVAPWIYLFVDAHNRCKWSKHNLSICQAGQLALIAIQELEEPTLLRYLSLSNRMKSF